MGFLRGVPIVLPQLVYIVFPVPPLGPNTQSWLRSRAEVLL